MAGSRVSGVRTLKRTYTSASSPPPTPHGYHFYRNKVVERYASQKSYPISLRQLLFFGRRIDKDRIIRGANFVRSELPVRIAHRIRDLQHLPFVVGTHPSLASVYALYVDAFEKIRRHPPIETLEDNDKFCHFMKDLLSRHLVVIPRLAIAIAESATHLPPEDLDGFMTRMLRSRISRRVLTEHHIALSSQFRSNTAGDRSHERFVGVVDSELNVGELVNKCVDLARMSDFMTADGSSYDPNIHKEEYEVEVKLDGNVDGSFAYIPDHLEYMVFELLKNSRRAVLSRPPEEREPIRVTLVFGPRDLIVRISDRGGGIKFEEPLGKNIHAARPGVFSFLYSYSLSTPTGKESLGNLKSITRLGGTVREQVGSGSATSTFQKLEPPSVEKDKASTTNIPTAPLYPRNHHERLGIGLPLSRIFANYFGGHLEIYSLPGQGVDAYLRIPRLGTQLESAQ